jgi:hypothetical protein
MARRPPRPISDDDRAEIRYLHAQGKGRNEIARIMRRSGRTISEEAAEMGLSFARAAEVRQATEIRAADLAELRTNLAYDLTVDAVRLREQLWEPCRIYNFGGKDNTLAFEDVDEPPPLEKKNLMTTVGVAIDRSVRLVPLADDTGEDAARSMVGQLIAGLTAIAREQQQEAGGDEGAGDAP